MWQVNREPLDQLSNPADHPPEQPSTDRGHRRDAKSCRWPRKIVERHQRQEVGKLMKRAGRHLDSRKDRPAAKHAVGGDEIDGDRTSRIDNDRRASGRPQLIRRRGRRDAIDRPAPDAQCRPRLANQPRSKLGWPEECPRGCDNRDRSMPRAAPLPADSRWPTATQAKSARRAATPLSARRPTPRPQIEHARWQWQLPCRGSSVKQPELYAAVADVDGNERRCELSLGHSFERLNVEGVGSLFWPQTLDLKKPFGQKRLPTLRTTCGTAPTLWRGYPAVPYISPLAPRHSSLSSSFREISHSSLSSPSPVTALIASTSRPSDSAIRRCAFVCPWQLAFRHRYDLGTCPQLSGVLFQLSSNHMIVLDRIAAIDRRRFDEMNQNAGPLDVAKELVPQPDARVRLLRSGPASRPLRTSDRESRSTSPRFGYFVVKG